MKTCVALNVIHLVKALHIQGVCFAGHVEEPMKTEANGKRCVSAKQNVCVVAKLGII